MEPLDEEIGGKLPWLPAARWFAAMGRDGLGERRIVLRDAVSVGNAVSVGSTVSIGLLDVVEPGDTSGGSVRYAVPMMEIDGRLVDAASNDVFVGWLVNAVLAGESLAAGRGAFRGSAVGSLEPPGAGDPLSIVEVGADASNTTLSVSWGGGPPVIVKLVRRCRDGIHPEVEVGRFLAASPVPGDVPRPDVPRLLGWLEYVPENAAVAHGSATIAIVQEQVDARGSAWDVMLDLATDDWPRCLALAGSLGETTARLHAALGCRDDEPAFAPEPWTADAWAAAVRSMEVHATRVLDRLERLRETLPARLAADLAAVASARSRIMAGFAEQAKTPPSSHRIRVHGDYHLGQVLVGRADDRCTVIDFEGEPGRTLAERREKTSAAKDVAGMCRSFDYLLRVLAKEGRRPWKSGDLESLESRFLTAYETASRSLSQARPGMEWWPENPREAAGTLALWKLDKALYELAYEADHRPDWIDVPLAAVAAFAGR